MYAEEFVLLLLFFFPVARLVFPLGDQTSIPGQQALLFSLVNYLPCLLIIDLRHQLGNPTRIFLLLPLCLFGVVENLEHEQNCSDQEDDGSNKPGDGTIVVHKALWSVTGVDQWCERETRRNYPENAADEEDDHRPEADAFVENFGGEHAADILENFPWTVRWHEAW